MTEISGHYEDRFIGVVKAMQANFENHGEVGASVAVVHEGEMAVSYTHLTLPTICSV